MLLCSNMWYTNTISVETNLAYLNQCDFNILNKK